MDKDNYTITINSKKYKIIKELGEGGFRKVLHIFDYFNNKDFAINLSVFTS